jgi:nucleoside-diphosphate kinase
MIRSRRRITAAEIDLRGIAERGTRDAFDPNSRAEKTDCPFAILTVVVGATIEFIEAPGPLAHALPAQWGAAISRHVFRNNPTRDQDAMAVQRTFSILKPDVTRRNLTGAVNQRIEAAGLRIVAQKRLHMSRAQAETFYGVHRERPFFGELVEMMTAAPVVVQVLEGEEAIQRYRDVMGATNPEKAAAGTIRKDFALSMGENSAHGSDAPETAAQEIAQFFSGNEIVG